eukprot:gene2598-5080_t
MSEWNRDDDADENDDGNIEDEFKSYGDHIIFLIDARQQMLSKNIHGEELLINSLKVALAVMKSKIVASDNVTVGIYFFGVQISNDGALINNIYALLPLDTPTASRIKTVQNLISDPNLLRNTITPQLSSIVSCPLKTSLWTCAQAFSTKMGRSATHKLSFKRIWIFTNDDHPNAHDKAEQMRIIQVAKDAAETGIEISLWCYNTPSGTAFDINPFYKQLLLAGSNGGDGANEEETEEETDLSTRVQYAGDEGSFDSLLSNVRRKEYSKRQAGSIPLYFSSSNTSNTNLSLAVKMFKLIQPSKKPLHTWLVSRTNCPVRTTSRLLDSETGAVLDNLSISTAIDVAGTRIPMTKQDMINITTDSSTGIDSGYIKILYFAPWTALKLEHNFTSPIFIFPDEMKVKGSATLFAAILDDMLSKSLIAIGVYARNKGSMPRIIAIVPQVEVSDTDTTSSSTDANATATANATAITGHQRPQPGGMNIIPLPFDGEIRAMADKSSPAEVSNELVEAAAKVIKAVQFEEDFEYIELENPVLQRFYSVLQAVALTESSADWIASENDMLQPDPEGIALHKEEILSLLALSGCSTTGDATARSTSKGSAATKSKKRVHAGDADTAASDTDVKGKKVKKVKGQEQEQELGEKEEGNDFDKSVLRAELANETIKKRTLVDLKEVCKELGLKVTGTKPQLIERIAAELA